MAPLDTFGCLHTGLRPRIWASGACEFGPPAFGWRFGPPVKFHLSPLDITPMGEEAKLCGGLQNVFYIKVFPPCAIGVRPLIIWRLLRLHYIYSVSVIFSKCPAGRIVFGTILGFPIILAHYSPMSRSAITFRLFCICFFLVSAPTGKFFEFHETELRC